MEKRDGGSIVAGFVEAQLALLHTERQSELDENHALLSGCSFKELQRLGVALLRLHVKSAVVGMGGRMTVKLAKGREYSDDSPPLPAHRFTPGDIVALIPSKGASISSLQVGAGGDVDKGAGVVFRVSANAITIALSSKQEGRQHDADADSSSIAENIEIGASFNVFQLANDVTYKRMRRALQALRAMELGESIRGNKGNSERREKHKADARQAARLRDVLFGVTEPVFHPPPRGLPPTTSNTTATFDAFEPFNKGLNTPQLEAIEFALRANDLALIHGPPGTGKTTTVVELILQAVKRGEKVLVTAPSNIAVDNIAEKLAVFSRAASARIIRVGHPARVLPSVQSLSLDARLKHADETALAGDVRKEMTQLQMSLRKIQNRGEKFKVYRQLRDLRKEVRIREGKAVNEIVDKCNVILATTSGCDDKSIIDVNDFDMVIIDEAAQAVEPSCWIPILKGKRLVLAGDHKQLPPTIMSKEAAKAGLERTLFERMYDLYGKRVTRTLTIQYRMHTQIMTWSSDEFYEGQLTADPAVAKHLLSQLPGITQSVETTLPLVLIDTAGCGMHEQTVKDTDNNNSAKKEDTQGKPKQRRLWTEASKANEGEVDIVFRHVIALLKAGIKGEEIGVISPYNAQVEKLRNKLREQSSSSTCADSLALIEIASVDGFQGREKEAIIISMVRSNGKREVGFLAEERRMNVAITRGRRHVCIVCDSETVSVNPFLKRIMSYCEKNAEYWSAQQYMDDTPMDASSAVPVPAQAATETLSAGQHLPAVDEAAIQAKRAKQQEQKAKKKAEREKATKEKEEKRAKELDDQLEAFLKDDDRQELRFPASLSSFERMLVHDLSGKKGLVHESTGNATKGGRVIIVSKPISDAPPPVKPDTLSEELKDEGVEESVDDKEEEEEEEEDEEDLITEQTTTTTPPSDLQALRAEQHKKYMEQQQAQQPKAKKAKAKKAKANRGGKAASAAKKTQVKQSDDDLFNQFDASRCALSKCRTELNALSRICPHCHLKFCMTHSMPEVHGCGEAARKKAREDWLGEKLRADGSVRDGTKARPLSNDKRSLLENKLQSKIASSAHKKAKAPESAQAKRGGRGGASASRGGRGRPT